jgi:uncharacterized protein YuzE
MSKPKFKWDGSVRAGYLSITGNVITRTTVDESGTVAIDYDSNGDVVGIEVI